MSVYSRYGDVRQLRLRWLWLTWTSGSLVAWLNIGGHSPKAWWRPVQLPVIRKRLLSLNGGNE